jgi:hypothetical protein
VPRVRTVVRGERASWSIVNRTTALWSVWMVSSLIFAGSGSWPIFVQTRGTEVVESTDLERLEAALMLRVEQEQTAAQENQKRLVNALRENSELRARLSDSSASVRRTVLLEDIEDSDSLAPVPAPPPRRRRSSSASLFGDEDPISSLRGRSAVPRSPRRRSASGSSFVDVGPVHKTRAPRSAARTPRRRGTTPTIDDYYAKYSRSTAERLYEHDNATRRTFDEAARHAEALFAAHDMSPARD